MKKISMIFACITAFSVLLCPADAMTINPVSVDQNSGDVCVSGKLDNGGSKRVLLHLLNSDSEKFEISGASDNEIKSMTRRFLQGKSNEDGTFEFKFNINEVTDDEGIFIVRLKADGENVESLTFKNYKNETLNTYRTDLNDIIRKTAQSGQSNNPGAETVSAVSALVRDNYGKFLADCTLLDKIVKDEKLDEISKLILTMNEFDSNKAMINGLQKAAVIYNLNTKSCPASELFGTYGSNLELTGLNGYSAYDKFGESEKTLFFKNIERMALNCVSSKGFDDSFSGAVMFTQLENNYGTKGKEAVLRSYPSILSFEVFNKSGNDTDEVIKKIESGMKNGTVNTVSDIQKILNTYIEAPNSKKTSGSGGGGSYGSGIGLKNENSAGYNPSEKVGTVKRGEFTDLDSFDWARDSIERLSKMGILSGVSDTLFEPNRNVTRAEFAKMLCGCFGIIPDSTQTSFSDVPENEWFAGYVAALVKRGIVNGRNDVLFAPHEEITREEMAVITYRAGKELFEKPTADATEFSDNADISDYAMEAVTALSGQGYLNGMPDGSFKPKNSATRAEAAKFIDVTEKFVSGGAK